jgi:hypothetical protein
MELESVMPTLVVLAETRNDFGHLVPVSSDKLADGEHGTVHETEWRILLQGLFQQPTKRWKRFVAMLDKLGVGWQTEVVRMVGECPAPDVLEEFLWCGQATEQQDGDRFAGRELGMTTALRLWYLFG